MPTGVYSPSNRGSSWSIIKKWLSSVSNSKVLVENINIVKKHQKGNPNTGQEGGIIEKEMPVHISNVMLLNPLTNKGDKVGIKRLEDGKKVRFFKSNNEVVDI